MRKGEHAHHPRRMGVWARPCRYDTVKRRGTLDETEIRPQSTLAAKEPEDAGAAQRKQPRLTDGYGLVLVLLITSYFVSATAGNYSFGRALTLVVLATTTGLALRASHVGRRASRVALALIVLAAVAGVTTGLFGSDETGKLVSVTLTAILVVVAPLAIGRHLVSHRVVDVNTFYGAVCIYLLIAMFFASAFAFLAAVGGAAFFAQDIGTVGTIDYLYFSLTTITTVGYGDLTAQGNVGRILAVLEAVLGQLYLITVVALVVQNLGRERNARRKID
jgi:hypothetical protein